MRKTMLLCDRCDKDYSAESVPVTCFSIKVGGMNYAEDFIVRNKDYCRGCLADIRRAIVSVCTQFASAKSRA